MNENNAKMGTTQPSVTPIVNKKHKNEPKNFKSLMDEASFTQITPDRTLCRFDMFCVIKPEYGPFKKNGKFEFTYRGDAYSTHPAKMIKYLLGIIKNYHYQYSLMLLRDNSKINFGNDRTVFKLHRNMVEKSKIPNYAELLERFYLPEWLATEVDE